MSKDILGVYNIEDIRQKAKKRLPKGIFDYVDRGAEDDIALRNNREAYETLKFKNRVLVDVSKRSTKSKIFGEEITMPFGVSPTGTVGLMAHGGEVGVAKAAVRMGVPCCVSTNAQTSMEEVFNGAGGDAGKLWFQVYMWPDLEARQGLIDRARACGFKTLVITVDGPVGPNREYNKRTGYGVPVKYTPQMVRHVLMNPGWLFRVYIRHLVERGPMKLENYPEKYRAKIRDKEHKYALTKADNQSWDDIRRIRDNWDGNVLVKGLQSPEDAVIAADIGCDGVVISNHGGRYVDCAVAPIQVLPEVRAAVGRRLAVIVDSGPRRGSDIVKGLALGADLVMSGRPTLFGAAYRGEAGAYRALEIFHEELDRVMAQLGMNSVSDITPDVFWNPPETALASAFTAALAAE